MATMAQRAGARPTLPARRRLATRLRHPWALLRTLAVVNVAFGCGALLRPPPQVALGYLGIGAALGVVTAALQWVRLRRTRRALRALDQAADRVEDAVRLAHLN